MKKIKYYFFIICLILLVNACSDNNSENSDSYSNPSKLKANLKIYPPSEKDISPNDSSLTLLFKPDSNIITLRSIRG